MTMAVSGELLGPQRGHMAVHSRGQGGGACRVVEAAATNLDCPSLKGLKPLMQYAGGKKKLLGKGQDRVGTWGGSRGASNSALKLNLNTMCNTAPMGKHQMPCTEACACYCFVPFWCCMVCTFCTLHAAAWPTLCAPP
jgi:hypothetical protein